jgi:excisionase family DNA binding protein
MSPRQANAVAVTLPELAQMLRISVAFAKRLVAQRMVPSVKLGRCRRVPIEAVHALLRQRCEEMQEGGR